MAPTNGESSNFGRDHTITGRPGGEAWIPSDRWRRTWMNLVEGEDKEYWGRGAYTGVCDDPLRIDRWLNPRVQPGITTISDLADRRYAEQLVLVPEVERLKRLPTVAQKLEDLLAYQRHLYEHVRQPRAARVEAAKKFMRDIRIYHPAWITADGKAKIAREAAEKKKQREAEKKAHDEIDQAVQAEVIRQKAKPLAKKKLEELEEREVEKLEDLEKQKLIEQELEQQELIEQKAAQLELLEEEIVRLTKELES